MAYNTEIEGINKFKSGMLFLMISTILLVAGQAIIIFSVIPLLTITNTSPSSVISTVASSVTISTIGFVLLLFSPIIYIVGIVMARSGFGILSSLGRDVGIGRTGATMLLVAIILAIISLAIAIASAFSLGLSSLSSLNSGNLSPSEIGALGGFAGGIILFFIAGIIAFIGQILFSIGVYKFGDVYNNGNVKIGGILMLVGFLLGLASIVFAYAGLVGFGLYFVGTILAYVGSKAGLSSPYAQPLMSAFPQPPMYQPPYQQPYPYQQNVPYQQPYIPYQQTQPISAQQPPFTPYMQQPSMSQFYQVGQGVIRSDGNAQLTLYAQTFGIIVSANIQGTPLMATYINPVSLAPGQNNIKLYFGNVSSLTPGQQYIITFTINANGNMVNVNATAVYIP